MVALMFEKTVKKSFIRYIFGQENLIFDRRLSGKSQEILKMTLCGNPTYVNLELLTQEDTSAQTPKAHYRLSNLSRMCSGIGAE